MENEIIQKQISNLPNEIKKIIANKLWFPLIEQVSATNNFSIEQKTALENEVLFVLLGMELLSDFEKNLQENMGISEHISKNISDEIYENVFKRIEEFLPKEVESEDTEEEKGGSPAIPENKLPEIPLEDLPAVIPNEEVHEVKPLVQVERSLLADRQGEQYLERGKEESGSQPPSSYPAGQDPYREPLA